jgi:hypothetical protein
MLDFSTDGRSKAFVDGVTRTGEKNALSGVY